MSIDMVILAQMIRIYQSFMVSIERRFKPANRRTSETDGKEIGCINTEAEGQRTGKQTVRHTWGERNNDTCRREAGIPLRQRRKSRPKNRNSRSKKCEGS